MSVFELHRYSYLDRGEWHHFPSQSGIVLVGGGSRFRVIWRSTVLQEFDPAAARFKYRSPAVGVKVAGVKFQLSFTTEGEYVRFCQLNHERSELNGLLSEPKSLTSQPKSLTSQPGKLTKQPGQPVELFSQPKNPGARGELFSQPGRHSNQPGEPCNLFNPPEGRGKLNDLRCEAAETGEPSGLRNNESSGFFSQSVGWGSQAPAGASQVTVGASQAPFGAFHDWRRPVHASFSPDTTRGGTGGGTTAVTSPVNCTVNSEFLAQILNEPSQQLRASVIAKLGDPSFIEKVEQVEQILKDLR